MAFFRVKLLRPEERQVTLRLRSECLPAAFHNFYPKNWVFRLHPLTAHLPYTSLMDAVVKLHEKRPALPEKLNGASQKGKELELKHFNISEL